MDELFFGAPITQKVKSAAKKVTSIVSKGWNKYMKGVSPGGEEFTVKLDKLLASNTTPRPNFL